MTKIDKEFQKLGYEVMLDEGEERKRHRTTFQYVKLIEVSPNNKYYHVVGLVHKANGNHLIQSYQKDFNSDGFNNMVGLSCQMLKLCIRKMEELGWIDYWGNPLLGPKDTKDVKDTKVKLTPIK